MKISTTILSSLMLASASVNAQVDTAVVDTSQQTEEQYINDLEQRVLQMGYEKKIKAINDDGSTKYEYVRTFNACSQCGMG